MKKGLISIVALAALTLSACSNVPAKNNRQRVEPPRQKQYQGNLDAEKLTPRQTAASVTVYAAAKYGSSWQTTLAQAQKGHLTVVLRNSSDFSYIHQGSGVAYQLGENSIYTLRQQGKGAANKFIYLYANQHELNKVSVKEVVRTLNRLPGKDKLVKKLAARTVISSQQTLRSNKHAVKGDAGLFTIPIELRGTWYSMDEGKMSKLVLTEHSLFDGQEEVELHQMQAGFDFNRVAKNQHYVKQVQDWGRAMIFTSHGIKFMNVRGWLQGAGDGESYGLQELNGQRALISASGAGTWTDSIYWRNEALARQNANKKFKTLVYR